MTAISTRTPPVTIEYDSRGKRVTKTFDDASEAKKFYAAKDRAGKNPKVQAAKSKAAASGTKTPRTMGEIAAAKEKAAEPAKKVAAKSKAPAKAKAAKGKKAAKGAKAKDKAAGTDRFGSRLGTQAANLNAKLSKTPKSMGELMRESGAKYGHYRHLDGLAEKGLVAKDADGRYRLA